MEKFDNHNTIIAIYYGDDQFNNTHKIRSKNGKRKTDEQTV